jgi:hypothetical protein
LQFQDGSAVVAERIADLSVPPAQKNRNFWCLACSSPAFKGCDATLAPSLSKMT